MPLPLVEVVPEPAAEAEPEPVETEAEPEPVEAEPELVVTETMAEIFLRQGHHELALAVYSQLRQRDPANERIAEAAARLAAELSPSTEASGVPAPEPVPSPPAEPMRYDAAATGGRSVAGWLGQILRAERPASAAGVHPPAFESGPRRVPENGAEPLSLSAVFGDEGPAGPAANPALREGPSFEQFYAAEPAAEPELPRAPEPEASAAAGAGSAEDLEQFNAWLRSLKR
jgi:hypothetical protein